VLFHPALAGLAQARVQRSLQVGMMTRKQQMIDEKAEVVRLRNEGLTLHEIGHHFGKSVGWVNSRINPKYEPEKLRRAEDDYHRAPFDTAASETLQTFDSKGVHAVWEKALQRRHTDAEGAITSARTLVETSASGYSTTFKSHTPTRRTCRSYIR